ncbi:MAG: hypothetical protein LAO05_02885 [Acidobacteriia bacterium]|nr:hypothetical protein [Terriglobia bacterium]
MVRTLAYADVFDYPLTAAETHRDLVGLRASFEEVVAALGDEAAPGGPVVRIGLHYALAGREATVATRMRREAVATRMWPRARRSARALAALPWVRMVAVTGSLAVNSVEDDADIDLMVVAAPGRVWMCRAMVIAFARAASRNGLALCPNYVLSGSALSLDDRSLYTAHELLQMVPLAGRETYLRLLDANRWATEFLPNRAAGVAADTASPRAGSVASHLVERLLRGRAGNALEKRVARLQASRLRRKIRRRQLGATEAAFEDDAFKGHFDAHGARILNAWESRVRAAIRDR